MTRIAILDYGMGNLRSVGKALEHVGAEPFLTSEHARVREADGIVLPGVGAMPKAMERVRDLKLDQLLRERVEAAVPVIGLCMGMQLLFDSTTEMGGAEGIGLLRGPVEALDAPGLKVPQIGWNPVSWRRESPLNEGLPAPCAFYHANSFAPRPSDAGRGARHGGLRKRVRERGGAGGGVRAAVAPGEVGAGRPAALEELRLARRMILLPAVDIRDGKAVRLRQGHFDDETVYADDPLEAARSFVEAGARFLHIVDLDGAREGEPANLHHVERITSELDVPVELGGGLRSIASIRRALAAGASRVVLGTAAFTDPDLLDEALSAFTSRILVGVDVRGGMVSVAGWTRETQVRGEDAIRRMQERGVTRFVYTNVDRDGMLEGPDLEEVRRVSEAVRGRFLYSGGIGSIDDLRALGEMRLLNLAGVISGKALYEGRFGVREGQEALEA